MIQGIIFRFKVSSILFILLVFLFVSCGSEINATNNKTDFQGKNFIKEAQFLYDVFACGKNSLQSGKSKKAVENHCGKISKGEKEYSNRFFRHFKPFMAKVTPAQIPATVIYPFGGSDAHTAFGTFPKAKELITISLETSGDPRKAYKEKGWRLRRNIRHFNRALVTYLVTFENSNSNVMGLEKGSVPGQLSLSLAAAVYYKYKPLSLRYFRFKKNGQIYYYTEKDIRRYKGRRTPKISKFIFRAPWEVPFINMEVTYKRPDGSIFIHKHISANLYNTVFNRSGLKKYLNSIGPVVAMTKGASYLPWFNGFSGINDYLLRNMTFMICDSTGILPWKAEKAGFKVTTYGKWIDGFKPIYQSRDSIRLRKFFRSQPFREIKFQFGHSDRRKRKHLMILEKR